MATKTAPTWRNYAVLGLIVALILGAIYFAYRPHSDSQVSVADATAAVEVGSSAPSFRALDIEGAPYEFPTTTDKPTWLVFNATWCSSCRAEVPEVKALAQREDVYVVSVYMSESSDQVRPYAQKLDLTYRQIPDAAGEISSAFNVFSVPTHVLVDRDGMVRYVKTGPITSNDVDEALAAVAAN